MRVFGSRLFDRKGKSAGKYRGISEIGAELVFRGVPGKLVQRLGESERFGGWFWLVGALVESPGGGVFRVAVAPTGLGFLAASGLAVRVVTGSVPASHSWIRLEPPPADRAWSFLCFPFGLWHRDDVSSLSSPACSGHWEALSQDAWVTLGEHMWVILRERRRSGLATPIKYCAKAAKMRQS